MRNQILNKVRSLQALITLSILVLVATLAGSMVFFSFVMAPLVFIKLDKVVASGFMRAVFPWYYSLIIGLAGLAALLLFNRSLLLALLLAAVALLALYARLWLSPRINRLRKRQDAGDADAAARFEASHRLSVWINGLQLITVFAVLVMFSLSLQ